MATLVKLKDEYQRDSRYDIYYVEETRQLLSVTGTTIICAEFIERPSHINVVNEINMLVSRTDKILDRAVIKAFLSDDAKMLIEIGYRDGSIVPLENAQEFVDNNDHIFHNVRSI